MSNAASGLAHLKPFLPGLGPLLEDSEVSEIMINGPGNVWIEAKGRLTAHAAPGLDESALLRAAIHIARPLGLDPATTPIIDARLDDGSRVAICVPPASPHVAITIRRFGKRTFSPADLVEQKALPENVLEAAERMLMTRRNILVSGGTGSGKTTLLNALIELLPVDERIVAIEDTLELRIGHSNCVRFEARGVTGGSGDDPRSGAPCLAASTGSYRGGRGSRRGGGGPAASPQHWTRRVTHDRTRQQCRERPIENRQLRHARRRGVAVGGDLPRRGGWYRYGDSHDAARGEALCRGSRIRQRLRSEGEPMGNRTAGMNIASKLKTKRTARIGIALLVFGMLALITQAQFEPIDATVVRVIDGDTIRVRVQGKEYTVRLIGVDTPEMVHSTKTVQHFGAEANAYTKAALEAKTVTLEADPTGDTRDRYGRLLRYVHLDDQNFNARLIREGYGHAIRRFRYSLKAQFIRLEDSARKAGRGLWSPR